MQLRKKKSLIDQAIDRASEAIDAARPAIESAVVQVGEQVRELSSQAAESAKDLAKDGKEKAAPMLAEGRSLARDIADATVETALPKGRATADRAAELVASGRDYAATKVAEVKGEPQPTKGQKVRKVLLFGGLLAAAGFVVNKFRSKSAADNWQSSYVPPSSTTGSTSGSTTGSTSGSTATMPGTGTTTGTTRLAPGVGEGAIGTDDPMARMVQEGGLTDDPGGASPDEAVADAVDEPHPVTSPDDPAEVVDLDPSEGGKKG